MKKMPNLWEISQEITAFNEIIMLDGGEITKSHEDLEKEMLDLLNSKTDGCYEYIEMIQGLIKLGNEKKKKVQTFIDLKEEELKRFNYYILNCLENSGQEKFRGDLYEIKMKKPSEQLIVDDQSKIDIQYLTKKPAIPESFVVDKAKLKKAFKAGEVKEHGFRLVDGKKSILVGFIKKDKKKKDDKND